LKKLTERPTSVLSPPAAPSGCWKPSGNGLASVAAKVKPLSRLGTRLVAWVNPLWFTELRSTPLGT
jgi:hypothetical protein